MLAQLSSLHIALATVVALLASSGRSAAQEPDPSEVVARYLLQGEPATVSRSDLALELCQRFRHTDQGKEALSFLIDLELIRRAARAADLMPNRAEIEHWVQEFEERLQAQGLSFAQLIAQKGMRPEEFVRYAGLELAHERLVRRELELGPREPVEPEMKQLWLREARDRARVVTEPAQLAPGVVAHVEQDSLTEIDLGLVLLRTASRADVEKFARQIVLRRILQARADELGITVTEANMQQEVAARAREARANPAYRGVPFEQLLEAQGSSIEELLHSPVLRAQIQERKLTTTLHPRTELEQQLATAREALLRRHGARRRLSVIVIGTGPDGDAPDAEERLQQIRARIEQEMPFAEAARTYSEDPAGRIAGGDVGWHNREGSSLPSAVIEAAFAAEVGALSAPIRTPRGWFLVRVAGVEPEPVDEVLLLRLQQQLLEDERRHMLEAAQVRFLADAAPGGGDGR